MHRYPIHSTNIVSVGYDEVNEVLEIEFKLEIVHQYYNVPLCEYVAFMKSENVEAFYLNYIQSQYHFDSQ